MMSHVLHMVEPSLELSTVLLTIILITLMYIMFLNDSSVLFSSIYIMLTIYS